MSKIIYGPDRYTHAQADTIIEIIGGFKSIENTQQPSLLSIRKKFKMWPVAEIERTVARDIEVIADFADWSIFVEVRASETAFSVERRLSTTLDDRRTAKLETWVNGSFYHRLTGPAYIRDIGSEPTIKQWWIYGKEVDDFSSIVDETTACEYLEKHGKEKLHVIHALVRGQALEVSAAFLENLKIYHGA